MQPCRQWSTLKALLASRLQQGRSFWQTLALSRWGSNQHRLQHLASALRRSCLALTARAGSNLHRVQARLASIGLGPRTRHLLQASNPC